MREEQVKNLKKLLKDFEGKDVLLEFQNSIYFYTSIKKATFFVCNDFLVISNGEDITYVIDLGYFRFIKSKDGAVTIQLR